MVQWTCFLTIRSSLELGLNAFLTPFNVNLFCFLIQAWHTKNKLHITTGTELRNRWGDAFVYLHRTIDYSIHRIRKDSRILKRPLPKPLLTVSIQSIEFLNTIIITSKKFIMFSLTHTNNGVIIVPFQRSAFDFLHPLYLDIMKYLPHKVLK